MGFLETVTPAEIEAGRLLSLVMMVGLLSVGLVPPLRPYAHRIRLVMAGAYIACLVGFIVYCALFR